MKISMTFLLALVIAACGSGGKSRDAFDVADPAEVAWDTPQETVDIADAAEDLYSTTPVCKPAQDGAVRVLVFGTRIDVGYAQTYETFAAHFRGEVEAAEGCLATDRPNLLLFAEDAGLVAAFTGSRAAAARGAKDAQEAFMQVGAAYADVIAAMANRYSVPPARLILLAVTDTVWRAMDSTFGGIAKERKAWVMASANVAHVVETSEPATVKVFADPDQKDVHSVFAPKDGNVYNSALLWGPDGKLLTRVDKPFLTETEEDLLALSYGALEELRPIELEFARVGVLTSKDAWMPPAIDRLVLLGADLLIQPEAFSGWTIWEHDPSEWLPDVVTESAWNVVQKFPGVHAGAMPVLTGNFLGMVFDGQAAVFVPARPGQAKGGFVGQITRPGFETVGPWVMPDPGNSDPSMSIEERRAILRERGEAMKPGSGSEWENSYVESAVAVDLDLKPVNALEAALPMPEVGGESIQVAADIPGPARRPRMAAREGDLAIAWQEDQEGRQVIRVAAGKADGGFDTLPAIEKPGGSAVAPDVAFSSKGDLFVVYQEVTVDDSRLAIAVRKAGAAAFEKGPAIPLPAGSRDAWMPSIASGGVRMVVVFTDRGTGQDRVHAVASGNDGATFGPAVPIAPASARAAPDTRGNQWSPDVAISGSGAVAAWVDFQAYQWDVQGATSGDGGETWSAPIRIDDSGDGHERLHADPRVSLDGSTAVIAWTDISDRRADADARYRAWHLAWDKMDPSVTLDSPAGSYPASAWFPSAIAMAGGIFAVHQELSAATGDRSAIVIRGPGIQPSVVSDALGPGRWPDVASIAPGKLAVAWIDDRGGVPAARLAVVAY